jgi:hypothetical protein
MANGNPTYKVLIHNGSALTPTTLLHQGTIEVDRLGLHINGELQLFIPGGEVMELRRFKARPLGETLQVDHSGVRVFMAVRGAKVGPIRFMSPGKTKRLESEINQCSTHS